MESILKKIRVEVSPKLYIKDPFRSDLGILMVQKGAQLIHEMGMEQFTFKKLGQSVGSTEPAIYRYFENKHMLLLYLNAWYWAWMEHNLVFATANIPDATERLEIGLRLAVDGPCYCENEFLDPKLLRELVVNESIKGYLTKSVDSKHDSGVFDQVLSFGTRLASVLHEVEPEYEFPKTLIFTVMEASLLQSFNSQHLPEMTETTSKGSERYRFFYQLVFKAISNGQ